MIHWWWLFPTFILGSMFGSIFFAIVISVINFEGEQ